MYIYILPVCKIVVHECVLPLAVMHSSCLVLTVLDVILRFL